MIVIKNRYVKVSTQEQKEYRQMIEMRNFIDEVNSPFVQAYFDVGNVLVNGYPDQWIKIFGSRIKKVHFKDFKRLSATPRWSWQNWYLDESRSGGCALDMHVHDVDFINWAFGKPQSVTSRTVNVDVKHDSIITLFDYADFSVSAEAWWGLTSSYPFTAEYLVRFEKAAVELRGGKLNVYTDEDVEEVVLEQSNAYVNELVDFINCIKTDGVSEVNPPEASKTSLEIAFAEKLSADKKEIVKL